MGAEFGSRGSEVGSEQAEEKIVVDRRDVPPQLGVKPPLADSLLDLGLESMIESKGIREEALFGKNPSVPPTTQANNSDIPGTMDRVKPLSHSLLDPD